MRYDDLMRSWEGGDGDTVPDELRSRFDRERAREEALRAAMGPSPSSVRKSQGPRPLPKLPADYELIREIGQGGMGVVYLARERSLGRFVAVKVLHPVDAEAEAAVKRFAVEARHLARIQHPNVVPIYATGRAAGEPYITMAYVRGESLLARLRRAPIPRLQAVRIVGQAAMGVAAAHSRGIVHRDLKPANLLLDAKGRAYVTDFGLARDLRKGALPGDTDCLGTPAYMAPEQVGEKHGTVGPWTDVHALGVILFEALTRQCPYGTGKTTEMLRKVAHVPHRRPRAIDPRIPRELEAICLKAIEKDPAKRYADAKGLADDLERYVRGERVLAPGAGWRHIMRTKMRAHWKGIVLAASAVVLTAFLVLRLCWPIHQRNLAQHDQAIAEERHETAIEKALRDAEELRGQGQYADAVQRCYTASAGASDAEREKLVDAMVGSAIALGDGDDALDSWEKVLTLAPERPFPQAIEVTIALALRRKLLRGCKDLGQATDLETGTAELLARHIARAISGPYVADQARRELESQLATIQEHLHPAAFPATLAEGDKNQAVHVTADSSVHPREPEACDLDAAATIEKGEQLEAAGRKEEALALYRQAREKARLDFPIWSYTQFTGDDKHGAEQRSDWKDESRDCDLLLHAQEKCEGIAPSEPSPLRGGLVLRADMKDAPKGLVPILWVSAYDVKVADTKHQADVSLRPDGTARVGLADGTYRLRISIGGFACTTPESIQEMEHLDIDIPDMPPTVEVKGGWIELPVVRIRRIPKQ